MPQVPQIPLLLMLVVVVLYLPIQFRDIDGLLLLAIFCVSISSFGDQQFGQLQPAIT